MPKKVLLIRPGTNEDDAKAMANVGLEPVIDPYLTITPLEGAAGFEAALNLLSELDTLGPGDWVVATSVSGLWSWGLRAWEATGQSAVSDGFAEATARGVRFAAVGAATANKFSQFGVTSVLLPEVATASGLANELIRQNRDARSKPTVLIPVSDRALQHLPNKLTTDGWTVKTHVMYQTKAVDQVPTSAKALIDGEMDLVVLRSPSGAEALVAFTGVSHGVPVICGGPSTAEKARDLGLNVVGVAPYPTHGALAQLAIEYFELATRSEGTEE